MVEHFFLTSVFGNPLVVTRILTSLCIDDVMNVYIALHEYLVPDLIDERLSRCSEELLEKLLPMVRTTRKTNKQMDRLFSVLARNLWYRRLPRFNKFDQVVYQKLTVFVHTHQYRKSAKYFLRRLYGIRVRAWYTPYFVPYFVCNGSYVFI